MPVKTAHYAGFIYIAYVREERTDLAKFRDAMESVAGTYDGKRDVVVDVTRCASLVSAEIGIVAKLVAVIEKTGRCLRIIALGQVKKAFEESALTNKSCVVVYPSVQSFIEEVKKSGGQPAPAPSDRANARVIRMEGSLSGATVKDMVAQVESALRSTHSRVVIDLSKVKYVDSLCIGQLMYLDGKAKKLGKPLVLACPPGQVLDLFRDASLDSLFEIVSPTM